MKIKSLKNRPVAILMLSVTGLWLIKRIYYSTRNYDYDELIVTVATNWGDVECPLSTWVAQPPARVYTAIIAVKTRKGRKLPIYVVPLRYRNDALSVSLVKANLIEEGWKGHRDKLLNVPL